MHNKKIMKLKRLILLVYHASLTTVTKSKADMSTLKCRYDRIGTYTSPLCNATGGVFKVRKNFPP